MISLTFAEDRESVPVADGQADPLAGSDRSISDVAGEGALVVDDVVCQRALYAPVLWRRNGGAAAHLARGLLT